MEQREPVVGPELVGLLERSFEATSAVLRAVPSARMGDPSPCDGWTVGQLGGHLVDGALYFGRCVDGQAPELSDEEPRSLGDRTAAEFDAAARFNLTAFGKAGVLDQQHQFAFGPTPGWVIANIALSESLIHGWDLARATGSSYAPDAAVVDAVARFQSQGSEDELRTEGMFEPAVPAPRNASAFEELLAFTGRGP
ncbi:TIGR03086 family metal-binding protein [Saccharopolyspora mangrovi]|uniref:TIGR03086 family metal-binding protein n=1 Tax=Saccharopolyspora mangrovi TaxID=3082379 RepID=A0ABU6AG08_9PSEU|nr:TIGR03086 family metal-binding protein [Saccharopolyspora sp. S2-29]MEB3370260.1 TIGR03086 family metal-binding protein [Saccharopolyspora sp. S2-29]